MKRYFHFDIKVSSFFLSQPLTVPPFRLVAQALYSESVPENSPAGRLILQVSASDADIRSNAQISYELHGAGSELFIIDSDTGLCANVHTCALVCVQIFDTSRLLVFNMFFAHRHNFSALFKC